MCLWASDTDASMSTPYADDHARPPAASILVVIAVVRYRIDRTTSEAPQYDSIYLTITISIIFLIKYSSVEYLFSRKNSVF